MLNLNNCEIQRSLSTNHFLKVLAGQITQTFLKTNSNNLYILQIRLILKKAVTFLRYSFTYSYHLWENHIWCITSVTKLKKITWKQRQVVTKTLSAMLRWHLKLEKITFYYDSYPGTFLNKYFEIPLHKMQVTNDPYSPVLRQNCRYG